MQASVKVRKKVWKVGCMCAPSVRRAHRERADPGNARIARAAMCAAGRGPSPFMLAMGSWERRPWGSLPPWETYF